MRCRQYYSRYTEEQHSTWEQLFSRMQPQWEKYANPRYLEGLHTLALSPRRIPRLKDVNRFLVPRTGFRAVPVGGYIPAFEFFNHLRLSTFPTTVTIRRPDQMDYLPEPDIFHDVTGHVPMHTDPAFARVLVRFGECAKRVEETNPAAVEQLARFFWFTVEFGLMHGKDGCKVYGSGLLSSYAEIAHATEDPGVERLPFDLATVLSTSFEIDHFQPRLFVIDSFEHLYQLVKELEGAVA